MLGGRYRVSRMVSAGASTLIVDAEDTDTGRPVTVKLVRPEWAESTDFRRKFRLTMQAMSKLSHPNIAAIHDWGEEVVGKRTTVYGVSEYLGGGSLRDLFDRGRYLDPSQALVVGLEACRGLDFVHRKGLVHGELTPSKLVFGDDRRLRIVDFGLARLLGEREWAEPATLATHVARYASPEQALAQPLDGTSDVYSLALILVEAVTRQVPFAARSTVATLSARIGRLMPVSAEMGALAAVLERAGRPQAADRSTAAEFGRALVRAAEKLPRPAPIPILASGRFDEDQLRRPNDPTGGVARPQPERIMPIVPAGAAEDVAADEDDPPSAASSVVEAAAASAALAALAGADDDAGPDTRSTGSGTAGLGGPPAQAPDPNPGPGAPASHTVVEHPAEPAPGPGAAGPLGAMLPPPAVPDAPEVYDGDSDATRDELAALARAAATATLVAERTPVPLAGENAPDVPPPPATADDAAPRSRWYIALIGFLVLAVLAALGLLAYLLFRVPTHEVPDLAGLSLAQAESRVEEFSWEVDVRRERSDDEPDVGQVVRTVPAAGADLADGEPFLIVVSDGPELRTLPDLSGLTRAEAETALAELRLRALPAGEEHDEDVPQGRVISWSVPVEPGLTAGAEVLPDTEVAIVVSSGPAPRIVPDLVEAEVDDALAELEDLRLRAQLAEPEFSNDIPAGVVIASDPVAGTSVERGSTVTLRSSKGPDLVVLPDLTGMNLEQARTALEAAGLQLGGLVGNSQGTVTQAMVGGSNVDFGSEHLRHSVIDLALI
jgi:serine/threonine-protein kinase